MADNVSRRAVLRGLALGGTGLALASCGSASRSAPDRQPRSESPSSPPAASTDAGSDVDVRSYGAVGDGMQDDTDAILRALAALKDGQTLVFAAGLTFRHSRVLTVETAGVTLAGPGTLSASNEQFSSLQLMADRVTVRDLTLAAPNTTHRWSAPDQHRLFLGPHRGAVVRNVTVTGSAAAGIFCYGAADFVLEGVRVSDTRADGIHMTNGATNGTVTRPTVSRSGDDGVAVVSYEQDGTACSNITVESPTVRTTTGGRGVSVVGGSKVRYSNIDIDKSAAASVYVACEGSPYNTFPTSEVSVTGGRITGANTDSNIDHGAVLAYSGRSGGDVHDVKISGLRISATRASASRQIGGVHDNGGTMEDVVFDDLTLASAPTPYQGNVPASSVQLNGVRAAGAAVAF